MTCLHFDLNVSDLAASVRFYTQVLGSAPQRLSQNRAEWMLAQPCLRLAASTADAAALLSRRLGEL